MAKEYLINWNLLWRYIKWLLGLPLWPIAFVIAFFVFRQEIIVWFSRWSFNSGIVLSYISVLRWPIVVLVALKGLQPYIPELIGRLREFGAGPVSGKFDPRQNQEGLSDALKNSSEESEKPAVKAAEDENSELERLLTSPEAIKAYTNIYDAIFGTQLILLKRLVQAIPDGLPEPKLEDIFYAHQLSMNNGYPTFVHFVQFLIDNSLVLFDTDDLHYKLTNAGLYFLRHLNNIGRYESYKPF